jgi:hypothetical protein
VESPLNRVVGGGSKRYFRTKGCEGISSSICALSMSAMETFVATPVHQKCE